MTLRTDTLSRADVYQIALQRTSSLVRVPRYGRLSFVFWRRGHDLPLRVEAQLRRGAILRTAWDEVRREFDEIKAALGELDVRHVSDIGCGHALIDVLFWQAFASDISLIDIETSTDRHHNFRQTGSGYASLSAARNLLENNGVPAERMMTINPNSDVLPDRTVDLAISLLSCGFHYPAETYREYLQRNLRKGGAFVFDLRVGTDQSDFLSMFSTVEVIRSSTKADRLIATI